MCCTRFSDKHCAANFSTLQEMDSDLYPKDCWGYIKSTEEYYLNGPSTRFKLALVTEDELAKKLEPKDYFYLEDGSKTIEVCTRGAKQLNSMNVITLQCIQTYEYADPEIGKVTGVSHDYTQCLYPFADGKYLYYGTEYASVGSTLDSCQTLSDLGLTDIEIGPLAN